MTTLAFNTLQGTSGTRAPLGPPDPGILERNLAALARTCARTAELVRFSPARSDLRFLPTNEPALSVEVVDPLSGTARALASRRRPTREGEQIAGTIDVASTAAVVVMGFGAGHHVGALARRMRRTGVIAVFEPDVALLRAVLERIDHSDWLADSNTAIFTDPDDAAAITASLSGVEGIVMMGLSLLEHAPSLERLGEARTRFYKNFQDVIAAVRTTVATTLVHVRTTVGNVLRNLPWYVSSPGIADLAGTRAGAPAIVVSAGPSLERNIERLARPGVRERFTLIAAQTVLKPLLARGIKPHYVVALDHSEISARFYEGLTREDVEGVTLVVEPKVSPAVPRAFPGEIRLARDPFLDTLLGPGLAREMGSLPPGATVAHLAYYLARHLGADPVVLVGQDLGFTDGQYYAAGAAIHNVWACELNQFNSLERMEWERIRRMGSNLRRSVDHRGRPIFTDEQLSTYLVQFERDFQADTQRGLTVIDATEGGVAKRHTIAEPLASVIDRFMSAGSEPPPASPHDAARVARPSRQRVEEHVRRVQRDVNTVADLSHQAVSLLTEMLAHHEDQKRVTRLIEEVYTLRNRVESLTPAIELVHFLNQAGAFARVRADRAIQLDSSLTPLQRQKREIERDIANVEVLARSADELARELGGAADVLYSWGSRSDARTHTSPVPRQVRAKSAHPARAHAIIALPLEPSPFSCRDGRDTVVAHTIRRLSHADRLDSIVLLAQNPDAWRSTISSVSSRIPVRLHHADERFDARHALIRAARAGALDCWRAGLAGASVYDEVLAPGATLAAMNALNIDGALILGHDWCLVDPTLCDAVIERSELGTGPRRLTFSQAAPGCAGVFLTRALLGDLARLRRGSNPFATIGGVLSYMPAAPALDPIGRDPCTPIDPAIRDLGVRLIPDSPSRAELISRILAAVGPERAASAPLTELLPLIAEFRAHVPQPPSCLTVEVSEATSERAPALIADFAAAAPGGLLTLRADASVEPGLDPLLAAARSAGRIFVHLRTTLGAGVDPSRLLSLGADIISIDLPGPDAPEQWEAAHRALDALVAVSRAAASNGHPTPWIVPRLCKRDATYPVMEGWYDRWILTTGAAAIDPLAAPREGERIAPLPLPAGARRRFGESALYIRSDGSVHPGDFFDRAPTGSAVATITSSSLDDLWRRVREARGVSHA